MSSAIVLENSVDKDWWCRLDVMANSKQDLEPFQMAIPVVAPAKSNVFKDAGAWHLRAYGPLRSRLDLKIHFGLWPIVAWWIGDGRVSTAIKDGAVAFAMAFGLDPAYAFIKNIPPKAQEFVEVHGLTLVQSDWVPENFLAIVRGGMQPRCPDYRVVRVLYESPTPSTAVARRLL